MARVLADQDLAIEPDEDHVLGGDLLEAERRRLHPDAAAARVANRDVAPDEVVVPVGAEDAAAKRDLLAERLLGRGCYLAHGCLLGQG